MRDRVAGLVGFLEVFETDGFAFGEMETEAGFLPSYRFSPEAASFVKTAIDLGWVLTGFDWARWDGRKQFVEDPSALEQATIGDIERLLTAHIRAERFCEGHLGSMFDCGHLTAILRRLKVIQEYGA